MDFQQTHTGLTMAKSSHFPQGPHKGCQFAHPETEPGDTTIIWGVLIEQKNMEPGGDLETRTMAAIGLLRLAPHAASPKERF